MDVGCVSMRKRRLEDEVILDFVLLVLLSSLSSDVVCKNVSRSVISFSPEGSRFPLTGFQGGSCDGVGSPSTTTLSEFRDE